MVMAQVLLIYDIVHDGTRTKISELCLDYGLDRVQYSAFEGQLRRTHQEELMLKVEKVLGKRAGDVRLIPICEKDWSSRLSIKNERPETDESPTADGQKDRQKGQDA
jgi:CRISPR-associated protein Cas2